jgi:hypothetical protein
VILAELITGLFWAAVKIAAIMAISYAVMMALRKKPKEPAAAGLDDFAMPTPQIGRHFPVIFGTPPRDRGLFLFWYGDLMLSALRDDDIFYAWYYGYSLHLGVCHAGIDGVKQIWVGDVCVWPTMDDPTDYASDGQGTATVSIFDGVNIFGGYTAEGGYWGVTDIEYGTSGQALNSYLSTELGSPLPAFRGIVTLVMRNNWWGTQPYPKTVSVVCKATTLVTDGGGQWYVAKATINTYALNPAHILRQCLTDSIWGDGRDASLMGDSFTSVADDLFDEDFGLNYRYYPGPGTLAEFIDEILLTIDGYLYEDHATGKFEIGLCRGDYTIGALDAYDETDFEIVHFERPSPGDVPSRITLTFRDRSWPDQRPHAIYDDIALQARQGDKIVEEEIEFAGILDASLANTVVNRIGRAHGAMGAKLRLRCKQTMRNLHWGSVFKIAYDDPNLAITQMAVRVTRINYGTIRDNTIEMDVIEDVYTTAETIIGAPPDSDWTRPVGTESELYYDLLTVTAEASVTMSYELYSVSSPSVSPSASVSASPSASVSASSSASISASPSISPSASVSGSPSASISASPSVSVSGSPSASPSTSVSSSPS